MALKSSIKKPLVSIIMSIYNDDKYLSESVNSILKQTYSNYEFIIVDDGSTDNSFGLLKIIAGKTDRIFIFKRSHFGLTNSLNFALSKSNGKYIARMDADDISKDVRIEKQVDYLEKNPHIDFLGSNRKYFGNDKFEKKIDSQLPLENNIIKWNLFFSVPIIHPALMVRATTLKSQNGYSERYKYAQDYELYTRHSKTSNFHNLSESLLKYRSNNNPNLSIYHKEQLRYVIEVRRIYISGLLNRKISTKKVKLYTEFNQTKLKTINDLKDAIKGIKRIGKIFKSVNKLKSSEKTLINKCIGSKLLSSIKYQYHFGIIVILYLFFNSLVYDNTLLFKKMTWWILKDAIVQYIS